MKSLKQYIYEKWEKELIFDPENYLDEYDKHIQYDIPDNLTYLNCWDCTWTFAYYLKDRFNFTDVKCAVFGKGSHYVPIINYNGKQYIFDFTYNNQKQFHYGAAFQYRKTMGLYSTGDKCTEIIPIDDIFKRIPQIEVDDAKDFYEYYDKIFEVYVFK